MTEAHNSIGARVLEQDPGALILFVKQESLREELNREFKQTAYIFIEGADIGEEQLTEMLSTPEGKICVTACGFCIKAGNAVPMFHHPIEQTALAFKRSTEPDPATKDFFQLRESARERAMNNQPFWAAFTGRHRRRW